MSGGGIDALTCGIRPGYACPWRWTRSFFLASCEILSATYSIRVRVRVRVRRLVRDAPRDLEMVDCLFNVPAAVAYHRELAFRAGFFALVAALDGLAPDGGKMLQRSRVT